MEKVLKKPVRKAEPKTDYTVDTIKKLVVLNNHLTERVEQLTDKVTEFQQKLDQVSSRLGF